MRKLGLPATAVLADKARRAPSGCLEWTASIQREGYGQVWWRGRLVYAHRLAYETHIGAIPAGMFVCHACDNRRCIEPGHLFVGTQADNMRDMAAKGRAKGLPPQRRKLTEDAVLRIGALAGERSRRELAREFGVSTNHVGNILRGKYWAHVLGAPSGTHSGRRPLFFPNAPLAHTTTR